jgi:parvulin-like peptidyl-prolyl isomerase
MSKKSVVAAVLFTVVLFLSGSLFAAQEAQDKGFLVTVEGKAITPNDLYGALLQLYPQQADDTLNSLVNEILVLKEAGERKVTASEKELNERKKDMGLKDNSPELAQRLIKTAILSEKMIIEDNKLSVSEKEVKDAFDANKDKLAQPEQVHLKQIFLTDPKEADDVLLALKAGADFSKMAQAKSKDNANIVANGGDLGYIEKSKLIPEVASVVANMNEGQLSNIIKTSDGLHIIKLEEKKPAKEAKFDSETKIMLKKALMQSKVQNAAPKWFEALRSKSKITQPALDKPNK